MRPLVREHWGGVAGAPCTCKPRPVLLILNHVVKNDYSRGLFSEGTGGSGRSPLGLPLAEPGPQGRPRGVLGSSLCSPSSPGSPGLLRPRTPSLGGTGRRAPCT